jgi:hypothetical protein
VTGRRGTPRCTIGAPAQEVRRGPRPGLGGGSAEDHGGHAALPSWSTNSSAAPSSDPPRLILAKHVWSLSCAASRTTSPPDIVSTLHAGGNRLTDKEYRKIPVRRNGGNCYDAAWGQTPCAQSFWRLFWRRFAWCSSPQHPPWRRIAPPYKRLASISAKTSRVRPAS